MPRWTTADIPDQTGTTVVVTGANSGLGLRTAEELAAKGARVLMACRNQVKAAAALEVVKSAATGPPPEVLALDLADLASVRRCAAEVATMVDSLDVLVNNAGVMAIPRRSTADGFEMQFGTNHLGHFALTGLLLPSLLKAAAPRVVTVSSVAHWASVMRWTDLNWERRYFRWPAYWQSKLANLLFVAELDRRAQSAGSGLVSVGAHPGVADTALYEVGPQMTGNRFMARATRRVTSLFAQPDSMGALPQLLAATEPGVQGNDYYGPSGPLPGPFEVRGYPKRVPRSPAAKRQKDAARLWELSETLTGVTYNWSS